MNIGYEDDDLKPFVEPSQDYNDPVKIGNWVYPSKSGNKQMFISRDKSSVKLSCKNWNQWLCNEIIEKQSLLIY